MRELVRGLGQLGGTQVPFSQQCCNETQQMVHVLCSGQVRICLLSLWMDLTVIGNSVVGPNLNPFLPVYCWFKVLMSIRIHNYPIGKVERRPPQ